jgi:hypothetical protein
LRIRHLSKYRRSSPHSRFRFRSSCHCRFQCGNAAEQIERIAIAASIIVAALNNVFPKVTDGRWLISFAFELLHSFRFASVLADMLLPPGARVVSLVAFNLGSS